MTPILTRVKIPQTFKPTYPSLQNTFDMLSNKDWCLNIAILKYISYIHTAITINDLTSELQPDIMRSLSSNDDNEPLENRHLGNDDYFAFIASSSHPLLLTEHAANGLLEAPLK